MIIDDSNDIGRAIVPDRSPGEYGPLETGPP